MTYAKTTLALAATTGLLAAPAAFAQSAGTTYTGTTAGQPATPGQMSGNRSMTGGTTGRSMSRSTAGDGSADKGDRQSPTGGNPGGSAGRS